VRSREELQTLLETITENVYFDPPPKQLISYPCIIYNRSPGRTSFADNKTYNFWQGYDLVLITKDPDSLLIDKVRDNLEMVEYVREYISDNLHHSAFKLYF
jgi:hypothetical protein